MIELNRKLHTLAGKKQLLNESINKQKDVEKRMAELRQTLENEEILDEFDRVVFESIIDRVLVGGYNEDGSPDSYKLAVIVDNKEITTEISNIEMCSSACDVAMETCSSQSHDVC